MRILSILLIGWGILMAALAIATLFLGIMTPCVGIDPGSIFYLGIGVAAIYFGHKLNQKSKQSESEGNDQSVEEP